MRVGGRLLLLLLILAGPALAGGRDWQSLSPAEREVLAPLADRWPQLDETSQDGWLLMARRYPELPATEQRRLRDRLRAWAELSPAERERVRKGHAQAQRVPASDRQAKWERYQSLPPERKQELQARAAARRAASSPPEHPLQDARKQLDERTLLPRRAASAP